MIKYHALNQFRIEFSVATQNKPPFRQNLGSNGLTSGLQINEIDGTMNGDSDLVDQLLFDSGRQGAVGCNGDVNVTVRRGNALRNRPKHKYDLNLRVSSKDTTKLIIDVHRVKSLAFEP